jgi:hypothetical protein
MEALFFGSPGCDAGGLMLPGCRLRPVEAQPRALPARFESMVFRRGGQVYWLCLDQRRREQMLPDAGKDSHFSELGEDSIELFTEIERSFVVDLGDFQALCGLSVGDLARLVEERAGYPVRNACLSQITFYKLRLVLIDQAGIPRGRIAPSTVTSGAIPWSSRRAAWKRLELETGLALPSLRWPGSLLLTSLLMPLGCCFLIYFAVPGEFGWMVLLAILVWIGSLKILAPLARAIPLGCSSLGDLACVTVRKNYGLLAKEYGGSSKAEILKALRKVIALQVGVSRHEVLPSTRVPKELNIF